MFRNDSEGILPNVIFDNPCPETGIRRNLPATLYGPVIDIVSHRPVNSKIDSRGFRSKPLEINSSAYDFTVNKMRKSFQ